MTPLAPDQLTAMAARAEQARALAERIAVFFSLVGRWYWAKGSSADDELNFRIDPALAWELAGVLTQ